MTKHEVVIAGAGPTGLMLAGELSLAGVDVAIVERRTRQVLAGSRAGGLHARTLEVLDQRGIADRFIAEGKTYPVVSFNMQSLDISDFPTRHNYMLGLWQNHIERLLAGWVEERTVPIYRGHDVTGFAQDDDGVNVALSDGGRLRAQYLVGCDGGRSAIRKASGIAFEGWDATTSWLIAEAGMAREPEWGMRTDAAGTHGIGKVDGSDRARIVLTERMLHAGSEPTLDDIREALVAVYGSDFGIHSPTWISRFTDMTRQAAAYRAGRVLLAGDAAHVHPPMGGQGLNIGVQDAVNLGWKLAQVVKGVSPDGLLDTYHTERHAVAARTLHNTLAQVALRRQDARSKALGDIVAGFLGMEAPRRQIVGMLSGLDVAYEAGAHETSAYEAAERHPLIGRRMPDIDLSTDGGPLRLFTLLHTARPLLLNLGDAGGLDVGAWADRVQWIDARYDGAWELPVIGKVAAPAAVLVRPDGHVAWAGALSDPGLPEILSTWFGTA